MYSSERIMGERFWLPCRLAFAAFVLLLGGCRGSAVDGSVDTLPPTESPVVASPTLAVTATEGRPTQTPSSTPISSPTPTCVATATSAPTPTLTATIAPAEEGDPASPRPASSTPAPATRTPSATPVLVTDARVVYHNGFDQGGVGVYEPGALPWLDLLVQLGGTWYGPEREPNDGIEAKPLPEGYRWEATGGFGTLPNGEAWWTKSDTVGTARLLGPGGGVVVEVPLEVAFRTGGDRDPDPGPEPAPT